MDRETELAELEREETELAELEREEAAAAEIDRRSQEETGNDVSPTTAWSYETELRSYAGHKEKLWTGIADTTTKAIDAVPAAYRTYDPVYAFAGVTARKILRPYGKAVLEDILGEPIAEEEFNVREAMLKDDIPLQEIDTYIMCESNSEYEREKQRQKDLKTLNDAGAVAHMMAAMTVGVVNPINYVNVAGAMITNSFATGIVNAVGRSAIDAGIRYADQPGMTMTDVAVEATASGIVTGMIGGVVKLCKGTFNKVQADEMKDSVKAIIKGEVGEVFEKGGELYQHIGNKLHKLPQELKEILSQTPALQAATNECEDFRKILSSIIRNESLPVKDVAEGFVPIQSLETGVWLNYTNKVAEVKKNYAKLFKQAKKAENGKYTIQEFGDAVREMRITREGIGGDSYVARAAREIEAMLDEAIDNAKEVGVVGKKLKTGKPIKAKTSVLTKAEAELAEEEIKELVLGELLSESKETAKGYYMRQYSRDAIIEREAELDSILRKSLVKNNPNMPEEQIIKRVDEIKIHMLDGADKGPLGLSKAVKEKNVAGDIQTKAKDLFRKRTVAVDDMALTPFLIRDPLEEAESVMRKLVNATELQRISKLNGHDSFDDMIKGYKNKRDASVPSGSYEKLSQYNKTTNENIQMMTDTVEIVTGSYGQEVLDKHPRMTGILNGIQKYNIVRDLGCVLVTSIPDSASLISRYGLKKGYGKALRELTRLGDTASKQDLVSLIHATEAAASQPKLMGDLNPQHGTLKNWSDKGLRWFNKLTLLPYWNDFWKKTAAVLHYENILDHVLTPSKHSDIFLRQHRFNAEHVRGIRSAYEKSGYLYNGAHILPLNTIEDKALRDRILGSVYATINEIIVTPGAGDVPIKFRDPIWKAFFQYKNFAVAHVQNNVLPQFAHKHNRTKTGQWIAGSAMLYPLAPAIKLLLNNKEITADNIDFYKCYGEAAFGIGYEVGGGIVGALTPSDKRSSAVERLVRTTRAGAFAADALYVGSAAIDALHGERLSRKQEKAIMSLIPCRNLIQVKMAILAKEALD